MRKSGKERLEEIQIQRELNQKDKLTTFLKRDLPTSPLSALGIAPEETPRARIKRERLEAARAAQEATGVSTDVRDR